MLNNSIVALGQQGLAFMAGAGRAGLLLLGALKTCWARDENIALNHQAALCGWGAIINYYCGVRLIYWHGVVFTRLYPVSELWRGAKLRPNGLPCRYYESSGLWSLRCYLLVEQVRR